MKLLQRFMPATDEADPGRGRIDVWAPVILPLAMLVAKVAADQLAQRNTRLAALVDEQRAELATHYEHAKQCPQLAPLGDEDQAAEPEGLAEWEADVDARIAANGTGHLAAAELA